MKGPLPADPRTAIAALSAMAALAAGCNDIFGLGNAHCTLLPPSRWHSLKRRGNAAVAIHSESEVEAVLSALIVKLDKIIFTSAGSARLEQARRDFANLKKTFDADEKPTEKQVKALDTACNSVSAEVGDEKMLAKIWDIQDYITYRT